MRILYFTFTVCFLFLCVASCSKRETILSTGQVLTASQLPLPGFHGDTAYASVQSSALPSLYSNFRSVLSSQGLVKWDARYDCNHFASLYIALAQTQYAVAAWHSETKAQTLAFAEVWYVSPRGEHAIVAAATEHGVVFIEPQTGQELTLSSGERASIFFCRW